jgi:hypothetical protein
MLTLVDHEAVNRILTFVEALSLANSNR